MLNLTRARCEAAVAYEERRQRLDHEIRIAYVAYNLLGKLVEGDRGDRVLGAFYGELSKKSKAIRVPNPQYFVRQAAQSGIALSIAAIHSDFEWACRDLLSDLLEFWEPRFTYNLGKVSPPPFATSPIAKRGWAGSISEALRNHSADEGFLCGCYSPIGLEASKEDLAGLPLYDFFRRSRNRIIHQDGTAGRELAEFAKSQPVLKSFEALTPNVRRMAPSLPELRSQDLILLKPQHAILFLVVTFNLFRALWARVQPSLNEEGYLRMSAHYAYGASHHAYRDQSYRNVIYPASKFLRFRYVVTGIDKEKLIQKFKTLGLWDAMALRFKENFEVM
jgi:hypothetical protein